MRHVAAAICRQPAARPESWYVYICNSQTRNVCHSDRSVSGVEESTTLDNEPPQDKTCYLGRFLDSLRFARNDMSGGVPINLTGCIRYGASPSPGLDGVGSTPLHCSVYGVVPFNLTGCIRYGASPWRGWMALGQRRYIVPCIGWYHSTQQVVIATWRAAGCRPYSLYGVVSFKHTGYICHGNVFFYIFGYEKPPCSVGDGAVCLG